MMDLQNSLRIQAWLDHELPAVEASEVERWVASDPQAKALADQLRSLRTMVRANEFPRSLPESREFFWSRIERELTRPAVAPPRSPRSSWWRWALAPTAAVAAFTLLWTLDWPSTRENMMAAGLEVETPLDDTPSFTFRSEKEHMTVVWVSASLY